MTVVLNENNVNEGALVLLFITFLTSFLMLLEGPNESELVQCKVIVIVK